MKTCPQCGRVYADDLNFCLEDGSLLRRDGPDPDKTEFFVVPDSVPTVDVLRPTEPSPAIAREDLPLPTIADFRPRPGGTSGTNAEDLEHRRSSRVFFLNATGAALLVILSVGFIGIILYETVDLSGARSLASSNKTPEPVVNIKPTNTPTPIPTPSATPTPTPSPTPTRTPTKPVDIDNSQIPPGDTFPDPRPPDLTGRYYARRTDNDTVLLHFDVYDQDGGDFRLRDIPDKLTGSASLHLTDKKYFVGKVDWYLADGSTDEEELYICGNFDALCGKLPFETDYFIATHNP
jgi:hypothetical protein